MRPHLPSYSLDHSIQILTHLDIRYSDYFDSDFRKYAISSRVFFNL